MKEMLYAYADLLIRVAFYMSIAMLAQIIPVLQGATQYEVWPSGLHLFTALLVGLYQGLMNAKALVEAPPQKR